MMTAPALHTRISVLLLGGNMTKLIDVDLFCASLDAKIQSSEQLLNKASDEDNIHLYSYFAAINVSLLSVKKAILESIVEK